MLPMCCASTCSDGGGMGGAGQAVQNYPGGSELSWGCRCMMDDQLHVVFLAFGMVYISFWVQNFVCEHKLLSCRMLSSRHVSKCFVCRELHDIVLKDDTLSSQTNDLASYSSYW